MPPRELDRRERERGNQQQSPNNNVDGAVDQDEALPRPERPITRTLSTQSISRHVAYSPMVQHSLPHAPSPHAAPPPPPPPPPPTHGTPIQRQAVSPTQRVPEAATYIPAPGYGGVIHGHTTPHAPIHYHTQQLHLTPPQHPPQLHHTPPLQHQPHHLQLASPHIGHQPQPQPQHPHTHPPHSTTIHAGPPVMGPPPSPYGAPIHYYPAGPSRQVMIPPPPGTAYYHIPTYMESMGYYPPQYAYQTAHAPSTEAYCVAPHQTAPGARSGINKPGSSSRRKRLKWTDELHQKFLAAIEEIGPETAVPKTLMQSMNVPGLTRENIASHLQKYRMRLKEQQAINTSDDNIDAPPPPPPPPPTSSSGRSDTKERSPPRESSSQPEDTTRVMGGDNSGNAERSTEAIAGQSASTGAKISR